MSDELNHYKENSKAISICGETSVRFTPHIDKITCLLCVNAISRKTNQALTAIRDKHAANLQSLKRNLAALTED